MPWGRTHRLAGLRSAWMEFTPPRRRQREITRQSASTPGHVGVFEAAIDSGMDRLITRGDRHDRMRRGDGLHPSSWRPARLRGTRGSEIAGRRQSAGGAAVGRSGSG
ncbi:hypothetical protein L1887_53644 [Cichorium endivia]|nr:hypothetical protein L1887_53644 [Cichorium endivia]